MMKNIQQKTFQVLSVIFWSLLVAVVLLLVLKFFPVFGMSIPFRSFIVQSGSMEPSIMTGDMLLVLPQDGYQLNDVITFTDEQKRVVTHRIREVQPGGDSVLFVTQGDANRATDAQIIQPTAVIGRVVLTIPKLGFAANFSQSTMGVVLFVVIPATIIIYDESRTLFRKV